MVHASSEVRKGVKAGGLGGTGTSGWWCRGLPGRLPRDGRIRCLGATVGRTCGGDAEEVSRPGGNWGLMVAPLESGEGADHDQQALAAGGQG